MSFVVDLGSFEIRCGFSDDTSPCYIHRAPAPTQVANDSFPFTSKSPIWSSAKSVAKAMPDRESLHNLFTSIYSELTQSAAPIAFSRDAAGRLVGAPQLPFHFVVPEHYFAQDKSALISFASILFESGCCPAFYASRPSVVSTLASGRASSLVLDVGHASSTVSAVLEGSVVQSAVRSTAIGGHTVNESILKVLESAGISANQLLADCYGHAGHGPDHLTDICHAMKLRGDMHVTCPSAADTPALSSGLAHMYFAPDGHSIKLPYEARSIPFECLFSQNQPNENVAAMLTESKKALSVDVQAWLPQLVIGGTTATSGFHDRLLYEIKRFDMTLSGCTKLPQPTMSSHMSLATLPWHGAALACSSSAFAGLWVTKEEFAEEGEGVLRKKLIQ